MGRTGDLDRGRAPGAAVRACARARRARRRLCALRPYASGDAAGGARNRSWTRPGVLAAARLFDTAFLRLIYRRSECAPGAWGPRLRRRTGEGHQAFWVTAPGTKLC